MEAWNVFKHLLSIAKDFFPNKIDLKEGLKCSMQGCAQFTIRKAIRFCLTLTAILYIWSMVCDYLNLNYILPMAVAATSALTAGLLIFKKDSYKLLYSDLIVIVFGIIAILIIPDFKNIFSVIIGSYCHSTSIVIITFIGFVVCWITIQYFIFLPVALALYTCLVLLQRIVQYCVRKDNWENFWTSIKKAYHFILLLKQL